MERELEKQLVGSYCVCFNVTYKEIGLFIKNNKNIKSLEEIQHYFACCTKCKLCCNDIQKIIDFYKNQP